MIRIMQSPLTNTIFAGQVNAKTHIDQLIDALEILVMEQE